VISESRQFCPQCGSEDVVIDGSLVEAYIGSKLCKSCGYKNFNFPERTKLRKKRR